MPEKDRKDRKEAEPEAKAAQNPGRSRTKGLRIPNNFWYAGIVVTALISLYLKAILPLGGVFVGDAVRFSSETDAWYHMMLAKSTVLHLHRTFFDPMTFFPNGNSIHFGPFVSWGIAILSLILGIGRPSMHMVEVVGAFWPVLMGTLLILPVYHIAREIGGKGCGLLAALLVVILPGQLFSRTTLGFTDHHSSETLLSTISVLLFLLAIRSGQGVTWAAMAKMKLSKIKTPAIYSALAGISLGLYLDAWSMGILFEGILLIFILAYTIILHLSRRRAEYPGLIGAPVFFIAMLLVLPFANPANGFSIIQYSLFQPLMLLLGALFCLAISSASKVLSEKEVSLYAYPGAIAGILIAGLLIVSLALPQFTRTLTAGMLTYLFPRTGGAATVAELSPLLTNENIQANFPGIFGISPFFLALIGLAVLVVRYVREEKPSDLLIIIWSLVILMITIAANRSAYYYAVNVAILCAFLGSWILERLRFGDLEEVLMSGSRTPSRIVEALKVQHVLVLLLIFVLLIYPSLSVSVQMARYATGPNQDWFTSVTWLKNNTPSPGMDIYSIYERPPAGEKFLYPDTAYGVMSWWDYGHLIETIGHRYPNANPFQSGIGNASAGIPGSSPFFLAETEEEAEAVLSSLDISKTPYMNTRFVMTDIEMAVGKFYAMTAWSAIPITRYYGYFYQQQGDQYIPIRAYRDPYFKTMISRLHFFDGSETPIGESFGIAYQTVEQQGNRFSVISEPPLVSSDYAQLSKYVSDNKAKGYNAEILSQADPRSLTPSVPLEALKHYRLVHESQSTVTYDGQKFVKTFEHVPGAVISGSASPNSQVSIALQLTTNQQRNFLYRQSNITDSSGQFMLIVPYSTKGPVADGTNFEVIPAGSYKLSAGGRTVDVAVPESAVINGEVIAV